MNNYEEVAKKVQSLIQEAIKEINALEIKGVVQTKISTGQREEIPEYEPKLSLAKHYLEDANKVLN